MLSLDCVLLKHLENEMYGSTKKMNNLWFLFGFVFLVFLSFLFVSFFLLVPIIIFLRFLVHHVVSPPPVFCPFFVGKCLRFVVFLHLLLVCHCQYDNFSVVLILFIL